MVVNKAVDPGLIKVIENELLPELEARVPAQAERKEAATKSYPHKFTLVFDREGYSPELMDRMKVKQVAILTYHKYPGVDWEESEFHEQVLTLPTGVETRVKLAERGVCLSHKRWVHEILKRFDELFSTVTGYEELDDRIAKTLAKKTALLPVLELPQLPLHNNESELGARVQTRARDVSFQTRNDKGTLIKITSV